MAKELPYFRFSSGDWLGGKISAFGATEQGVYINLVAIGWQKLGEIEINPLLFCKKMEISVERLEKIISQFKDCGILLQDGDKFCIKFIEEQLSSSAYISKVRRKAVETRYKKQPQKPTNVGTGSTNVEVCSTKTDEMKGNETKGKDNTPLPPVGGIADKVEEKKEPVKKFIPPTLEQVKEYAKAHFPELDCEQFISFYQAKGWMIGKNKMKDWEACVRTWKRMSNERGNGKLAIGQTYKEEGTPAWNNL